MSHTPRRTCCCVTRVGIRNFPDLSEGFGLPNLLGIVVALRCRNYSNKFVGAAALLPKVRWTETKEPKRVLEVLQHGCCYEHRWRRGTLGSISAERERTDRKKGVTDWPSLLIARDKGEEREKKIGWRSPSYNCCILLLKKEGSSCHCRVGTREEASRISVVARSPDQGPNQSKKIPRGDVLRL